MMTNIKPEAGFPLVPNCGDRVELTPKPPLPGSIDETLAVVRQVFPNAEQLGHPQKRLSSKAVARAIGAVSDPDTKRKLDLLVGRCNFYTSFGTLFVEVAIGGMVVTIRAKCQSPVTEVFFKAEAPEEPNLQRISW